MNWHGLRIGSVLLLFAALGPARVWAAPSLGFSGGSQGGSIVWDGEGDVPTGNNLGPLTHTGVYSELGVSDPSQLAVRLTLTGVTSITIGHVAVLLSLQSGDCLNFVGLGYLGGCNSIADLKGPPLNLPLPSTSNENEKIIPFVAILVPLGPFLAHDGDYFRLSAEDQATLGSLLSVFPHPDQLRVGLAADFTGGGTSTVFTVTAVPEPATWLLLGSGLALVAVRMRRATPRAL